MITTELRKSWRFMQEWAGYSTPPGRAACALALARAELRAREEQISFCWQDDFDPDTSWMDAEQLAEYKRGETQLLGCIAALGDDDASCWGIHVRSMNDPYCRVMQAELASELLDRIDKDRAEEAGIHRDPVPC